MTGSSKRKGNAFERQLVKMAIAMGLRAERAYGSDGRSLGETKGVDVIVADYRIQAKIKKVLPKWAQLPDGCDVVAIRQDRSEPQVLIPYDDWLFLIRRLDEQQDSITPCLSIAPGEVAISSAPVHFVEIEEQNKNSTHTDDALK